MRRPSALVLVLLGLACQRSYSPRPLPPSFSARALDGASITASTMRGRPWLVNLWMPG